MSNELSDYNRYECEVCAFRMQQAEEIKRLKEQYERLKRYFLAEEKTSEELRGENQRLREALEALIAQVDNEHCSEYMDPVIEAARAALEPKPLQSPSKDTPDNYICVSCKLVTNHKQKRCIQCGCQTHEPTAADVTYPADTRHEVTSPEAGPDVNTELLEALQVLYTYTPDFPENKTEFDNGFVKAIYKAKIAIEKAKKITRLG